MHVGNDYITILREILWFGNKTLKTGLAGLNQDNPFLYAYRLARNQVEMLCGKKGRQLIISVHDRPGLDLAQMHRESKFPCLESNDSWRVLVKQLDWSCFTSTLHEEHRNHNLLKRLRFLCSLINLKGLLIFAFQKGRCLLPKSALSILSLETDLIFSLKRRVRAGFYTFFFRTKMKFEILRLSHTVISEVWYPILTSRVTIRRKEGRMIGNEYNIAQGNFFCNLAYCFLRLICHWAKLNIVPNVWISNYLFAW